jgi:hypothetical protein
LLLLQLLSHHNRIFFFFFDAEEGPLEAPAVWLDCDSAFRRVAFLLLTFLFLEACGLIFFDGELKEIGGEYESTGRLAALSR